MHFLNMLVIFGEPNVGIMEMIVYDSLIMYDRQVSAGIQLGQLWCVSWIYRTV